MTDVLHAQQSVPAFSRFIELLATHTKARNINILAYSAGAQIVAPGLAYFSEKYPDESKAELKKRLRIGEVYFAAPDTSFKPFVERYLMWAALSPSKLEEPTILGTTIPGSATMHLC